MVSGLWCRHLEALLAFYIFLPLGCLFLPQHLPILVLPKGQAMGLRFVKGRVCVHVRLILVRL